MAVICMSYLQQWKVCTVDILQRWRLESDDRTLSVMLDTCSLFFHQAASSRLSTALCCSLRARSADTVIMIRHAETSQSLNFYNC